MSRYQCNNAVHNRPSSLYLSYVTPPSLRNRCPAAPRKKYIFYTRSHDTTAPYIRRRLNFEDNEDSGELADNMIAATSLFPDGVISRKLQDIATEIKLMATTTTGNNNSPEADAADYNETSLEVHASNLINRLCLKKKNV